MEVFCLPDGGGSLSGKKEINNIILCSHTTKKKKYYVLGSILIYAQIKINNIFNDKFKLLLEYFSVFVVLVTCGKILEIYPKHDFESLQ